MLIQGLHPLGLTGRSRVEKFPEGEAEGMTVLSGENLLSGSSSLSAPSLVHYHNGQIANYTPLPHPTATGTLTATATAPETTRTAYIFPLALTAPNALPETLNPYRPIPLPKSLPVRLPAGLPVDISEAGRLLMR